MSLTRNYFKVRLEELLVDYRSNRISQRDVVNDVMEMVEDLEGTAVRAYILSKLGNAIEKSPKKSDFGEYPDYGQDG